MKRTVVIVTLCASGVLLSLIAACGGFGLVKVSRLNGAISSETDRVIDTLNRGGLRTFYETETAPEFRSAVPLEAFEELGALVRTRLGFLKSKKATQFQVRTHNGAAFTTVAYAATFEKGAGAVTVIFKEETDDWRLAGFYVSSPEFQKDLATKACAHCGELHATGAKFCPHCGKLIEG